MLPSGYFGSTQHWKGIEPLATMLPSGLRAKTSEPPGREK